MRTTLLLLSATLLGCPPARVTPPGDDDASQNPSPSGDTMWLRQIDRYGEGDEYVSHHFYWTHDLGDCGDLQVMLPGFREAEAAAEAANEEADQALEAGDITEAEFRTRLCENTRGQYARMAELSEDLIDVDSEILDMSLWSDGGDGEPPEGTYAVGGPWTWDGSMSRFSGNPFLSAAEAIDCSDPEWMSVLEGDLFAGMVASTSLQTGTVVVTRPAEEEYHLESTDGQLGWAEGDREFTLDDDFPLCEVLIEHEGGGDLPGEPDPAPSP